MALEPLFTGLIIGENAYFGIGPYKFTVPADLRDTDSIYFTWVASVHNGAVVIDAGSNVPGDIVLNLTSKQCIRTVADLRRGAKIFGTDMFENVNNIPNRYIAVKMSDTTLSMTYMGTGGSFYSPLIDKIAPNVNSPFIGIGPFYKIL